MNYLVVLQVFSVPTDDNELKYALEVRSGDCPVTIDECTLRGDSDEQEDGVLPDGFNDVESLHLEFQVAPP